MSKIDISYVLGPFRTRGGLQMEVQVCKRVTSLASCEISFAFLVFFCLFGIFFSCGSKKRNLATLKNVKIYG